MEQEQTAKENERGVLETYEQLAHSTLKKGYRHNPVYLARKSIVDWDLLMSAQPEGKRVLNVGCFEPIDEIQWSGLVQEWTAVDFSPMSIAAAREIVSNELGKALASKISFKVMDAQHLEFPDASFDIAVSFSVLDHIPDSTVREKAIHEMSRVVKHGGYVVVTVPNRYSYYRFLYRRNLRRGVATDVGFQYFYSYGELKKTLVRAGLQPIRFTSDMKNAGDLPKVLRGLALPLIFFGDRMGFLTQRI